MTISVQISSVSLGTFQGGTFQIGPLLIASAFSSMQSNSLTFGAATFISTVGPVGATAVVIEPPAANLIGLTLKGISGDTGIPIGTNLPTLLTFTNTTISNTVGLTSAAAIPTGVVTLTFF